MFRHCNWVSGLIRLTEKSKVNFPYVRVTILVLSSNRLLANITGEKKLNLKKKEKKRKTSWKTYFTVVREALRAEGDTFGISEGTGSLWIFIHASATAQMCIPTWMDCVILFFYLFFLRINKINTKIFIELPEVFAVRGILFFFFLYGKFQISAVGQIKTLDD